MRNWHDYHITGYTVDGRGQQVTFNVTWPYEVATDIKRVRLVFSGVEGYFLENDLGSNIICAFAEESLEAFLVEHAPEFEASIGWGWPSFWTGDVRRSFEGLHAKGVKCYVLSSSYGMSGWLLATHVEHHDIET